MLCWILWYCASGMIDVEKTLLECRDTYHILCWVCVEGCTRQHELINTWSQPRHDRITACNASLVHRVYGMSLRCVGVITHGVAAQYAPPEECGGFPWDVSSDQTHNCLITTRVTCQRWNGAVCLSATDSRTSLNFAVLFGARPRKKRPVHMQHSISDVRCKCGCTETPLDHFIMASLSARICACWCRQHFGDLRTATIRNYQTRVCVKAPDGRSADVACTGDGQSGGVELA